MPVGPTGCEGERTGGTWFVGAAGGATRARLQFEQDLHYDFEQQAITAFAGYATAGGWAIRGSLGAIVGGALDGDERPGDFDMGTGVIGAVSGSRNWNLGDGRWFVTGSLTASAGFTSTSSATDPDEDLTAYDLRVGAIAGRRFADAFSPYVLARAFGGPVSWRVDGADITGSDTTHVQLGAGASYATPFGLTAAVDISAVGEQSLSLAVSWQL